MVFQFSPLVLSWEEKTICHMCGSCFHWLLGIFTSRQESGCFFLYWFRQFVRKAIHFAVVGFYATIWFMLWLPVKNNHHNMNHFSVKWSKITTTT
jgi:hypothetical protein